MVQMKKRSRKIDGSLSDKYKNDDYDNDESQNSQSKDTAISDEIQYLNISSNKYILFCEKLNLKSGTNSLECYPRPK